ncbi:DivIVA domain-containing protein [Micromonospora sp. NPDC047707]|uniref:DivIVA domain-containing protein n=1 Tax=Micromonospora sp. NPDC047707 TaxID=3154498 RepID=UPI0034530453
MRLLFRRRGRHERTEPAHGSTCYRSASYHPLRPWQVRERRFRPSRFGRRGLDPDDVHEFLNRVADDLSTVYDALGVSRQETTRIKDALRRWQSEQARRRNVGAFR